MTEDNRFTIIRDTREQTGWYWTPDQYCVGTLLNKLDTGDYAILGLEDVLCIERKKSVAEFAKNIIEARFERELQRMSEFRFAFLICEFDEDDINRYPEGSGIPRHMFSKIRVRKNFILSKLSKIETEYNIVVHLCGSDVVLAKQTAFNIMKKIWDNHAEFFTTS